MLSGNVLCPFPPSFKQKFTLRFMVLFLAVSHLHFHFPRGVPPKGVKDTQQRLCGRGLSVRVWPLPLDLGECKNSLLLQLRRGAKSIWARATCTTAAGVFAKKIQHLHLAKDLAKGALAVMMTLRVVVYSVAEAVNVAISLSSLSLLSPSLPLQRSICRDICGQTFLRRR